MNSPLLDALDRAIHGDPHTLQGLGIEQIVITSPGDEDCVSFDGGGIVTLTSRRAPADRGGAPIGTFRTTLRSDEVTALITAVRAVVAKPHEPARGAADEKRIVLSVVAGGHTFSYGTIVFPPALEELEPALSICNCASARALASPLRSLSVTLAAHGPIPRSDPMELTLTLRNGGTQGAWVSNPLVLPNESETERAVLVYAEPLVSTPGVTPVTPPPSSVFLTPRYPNVDEPRYRWISPRGEISVALEAKLVPDGARELVLRAELHLHLGDDVIAGRPRVRGSVFTADLTLPVTP